MHIEHLIASRCNFWHDKPKYYLYCDNYFLNRFQDSKLCLESIFKYIFLCKFFLDWVSKLSDYPAV